MTAFAAREERLWLAMNGRAEAVRRRARRER